MTRPGCCLLAEHAPYSPPCALVFCSPSWLGQVRQAEMEGEYLEAKRQLLRTREKNLQASAGSAPTLRRALALQCCTADRVRASLAPAASGALTLACGPAALPPCVRCPLGRQHTLSTLFSDFPTPAFPAAGTQATRHQGGSGEGRATAPHAQKRRSSGRRCRRPGSNAGGHAAGTGHQSAERG